MTCENLHLNKIMIFSNRGYLDSYYRANLNIGLAIESFLIDVVTMQDNIPFENNLLSTDTNDTNTFVDNTSILDFTRKMQTVTDTFVSDVINILSQNRESRNMSNSSGLLNVEFFTTFEAIQTTFFKNLANYLSMFLFFHDQIAMPTFFPIYDVVDSNLDFTTFVLSDKDDLLKTNVRNMRTVDFRKYKRTFVALKNAFSLSSIANDSLISSSFIQQVDTFGVVVDKLKAFLRFSGEIVDRLDEYIIEWILTIVSFVMMKIPAPFIILKKIRNKITCDYFKHFIL